MAPPYQRTNARRELAERKWLGQIVIRPRIEALDLVFDSSPLRQYQDRQAGLFQPQVPQNADSVELRQVQIENYKVIIGLGGRRPRQFAIGENVNRIMLAF